MIPGLEPGALFGGRYEIIRCIGSGGMGAVYLACDPSYRDFLVALKVLYPGIVKSNEARERFRNEIVASYRVNHRNVVRAFEYFDSDDYQAYAMEYVDGGDLGDLMEKHSRGRTMPVERATDILAQIAAGLEAIHREGIVHRDLKPENVLLSRDGVAKISDFGVARLRGAVTLTAVGSMVGTPKYVSPEYVELGECDQRSDIYAAGIIGYEMIAGESPFKSESRLSIMMERFNFKAQQLRERAPHCPPEVVKIISKAMAVDLKDRYHSAGQLSTDLERIKNGDIPLYAKTLIDNVPPIRIDGSRLPGVDDVPLMSGMVNVADTKLGKRKAVRNSWSGTLGATLAGFVVAFLAMWIWIAGSKFAGPLNSLSTGIHFGKVEGLFGDKSEVPLSIIRTNSKFYALLGKSHCKYSPVDESGRFSCGELSFQLRRIQKNGEETFGEIVEENLELVGQWRLSHGES